MIKFLKYLFINLILVINSNVFCQNFWEKIEGPFGGRMIGVVTHPTGILIAATMYSGVYRSFNNGNSWEICGNNDLARPSRYCIEIDQNGNVYIGGSGGLFRSTDAGETWEMILSLFANEVWAVGISSIGEIYVGTTYSGIYYSNDGGLNWTFQNNGITNSNFRTIAVKSTGEVYAATYGDHIFYSNNSGQNWQELSGNFYSQNIWDIMIDENSDILYAAAHNGVFFSINNGQSWSTFGNGLSGKEVFTLFKDDSDSSFYAGSFDVWKLTDSNNWISSSQVGTDIKGLTKDQFGNLLLASDGAGIFKSSDYGISWIPLSIGISVMEIYEINCNTNGRLFVGTYGGGINYSSDNGINWTSVNQGLLSWNIVCIETDGENLYAGTSDMGLFVSNNNGSVWYHADEVLSNYITSLTIAPDGNLYAGADNGLYKSCDSGQTWVSFLANQIDLSFTHSININSLGYVFIASYDGLSRSTNNGLTWEMIFETPSTTIKDILIDLNDNIYTVGSGVYASYNNGDSWTWVENGTYLGMPNDGLIDPFGTIYTAGLCNFNLNSGGVNRSIDSCQSWQTLNTGFNENLWYANSLDYNSEGFLFCGTKNVGLYRSINPITKIQQNKNRNEYLNVFQKFSSEIIIEFEVYEYGNVTIDIINLSGQKNRTLISNTYNSGMHKFEFQIDNFITGIYFIRMITTQSIITKKIQIY